MRTRPLPATLISLAFVPAITAPWWEWDMTCCGCVRTMRGAPGGAGAPRRECVRSRRSGRADHQPGGRDIAVGGCVPVVGQPARAVLLDDVHDGRLAVHRSPELEHQGAGDEGDGVRRGLGRAVHLQVDQRVVQPGILRPGSADPGYQYRALRAVEAGGRLDIYQDTGQLTAVLQEIYDQLFDVREGDVRLGHR